MERPPNRWTEDLDLGPYLVRAPSFTDIVSCNGTNLEEAGGKWTWVSGEDNPAGLHAPIVGRARVAYSADVVEVRGGTSAPAHLVLTISMIPTESEGEVPKRS